MKIFKANLIVKIIQACVVTAGVRMFKLDSVTCASEV